MTRITKPLKYCRKYKVRGLTIIVNTYSIKGKSLTARGFRNGVIEVYIND